MRDRQTLPMFPDLLGPEPTPKVKAARKAKAPVPPPVTMDRPAAVRKRDKALASVEANAGPAFSELALLAIDRVARRREEFIVDEVWAELAGAAKTHENRAMGAVMRKASKSAALIAPTDRFIASANPNCHSNPRRVWRSLVFKGGADAV